MLSLLLLAHLVTAQSPPTLADAVQALKWDAGKAGVLLVLDTKSVYATKEAPGLGAFERKQMVVGGVTAIVPTEMVVIDDSFKQPPSLTDGLPREAKMLYLIQSLSGEQWQKASGTKGIGLNDLQGEQKAVFESLMPKPFVWASYRVNKDRMADTKEGEGTLTPEQTEGVRIRIGRRLTYGLELLNSPGYTLHDPLDVGEPGDLVLSRDQRAEFDTPLSFGVASSQKLPNRIKNSDLAYTDQAVVRLAADATVKEILNAVGKATGKELYADIRIADLRATVIGQRAKAGDILQALALSVTGTYRKVGPAYVLTSDLAGLGTRKLRFSTWWEDLMQATYARQDEWRKAIGERVDSLPLDQDGKLKLTDAMQKHIERQDSFPVGDWLDVADTTPELRTFLETLSKRMTRQPLKTNRVRIQSNLEYGFILPDGRALKAERSVLGQTWTFHPRPPTSNRPTRAAISLPFEAPEGGYANPIAFQVESPAEAAAVMAEAAGRGFREVWLETRNPEALKAAITTNLSVRLIVRPWLSPGKVIQDPDRTLLGDGGSQLAKRWEASEAWKRYPRKSLMTPFGFYDRIAPLDAAVPAVWASIANLAETRGLAGVVLLETSSPGYEPIVGRGIFGGFTRGLGMMRQFGYSTAQRLAFLRANGIDPVDIVDMGLLAGPDLRQPFFLDDALRGLPSAYDGPKTPHPALLSLSSKWQEFKAQANQKAILDLATRLSQKTSVLIDVRDSVSNTPGIGAQGVLPWKAGAALPAYEQDPMSPPERPDGLVSLVRVAEKAAIAPGSAAMMQSTLSSPGPTKNVVDLTQVPARNLSETLDYWFKRR